MAYALVGTIGAVSQGTSGGSVTPAWGAGESRTAGNLLICFCSATGNTLLPATPSGWTVSTAGAGGTSCSAQIFYKIAAGSDAAPTITGVSGGLIAAQLAEFSGNAAAPLDKAGTATATTSPVTATLSAADTASGELLLMCGGDFRSVARASNDTWTSNHGTITLAGSNNGTSSVNHYSNGYCLSTTSNSGADTAIMTLSITSSITGLAVAAVTFKLPAGTLFTQSLTATLSFVGDGSGRLFKKLVGATTSFSGALKRTITDSGFLATLTSNGLLNKRLADAGFVATLSFSGNFVKGLQFLRSFSATLFPSGLSDGDVVTIWPDSSSGNRALSTGSPIIKTTSGPNSKPVVRLRSASFDGFNLTSAISGGAPIEMFVVMKAAASTTLYTFGPGSSNGALGLCLLSSNFVFLESKTDAAYITPNPYTGAFHIFNFAISGAASGLQVDGVGVASTHFAISDTSDFNTIGYRPSDSTYSDGDIADIIIFNRILIDTGPFERQAILQYLSDTYGFGLSTGITGQTPTNFSGLTGWWTASAIPIGAQSFVTLSRRPGKALTATLFTSGVVARSVGKSLIATLSFVGSLTKQIRHSFTATLNFIGLLASVKLLVRAFTATLSFTGLLIRRPSKALSATLSFIGSLRNRIGKTVTATLSFVGSLTKRVNSQLRGTLSFIGALGTQFNSGAQVFFQTFFALLTPAGSLATSLSHVGTLFFQALTATLSFVGTFSRSLSFLKSFSANLNFNLGVGTGYYSAMTVNSGQVPSTQTDFPILINVTDARFKTVANSGHVQNSNGYDIRPYSDSGLTTPITGYQLERYDATTGEVVMWVKGASVSDGLVTYLKYGDASLTTDGSSTTTWSNNFRGVYHFRDGTTLSFADSSPNGLTGTATNTPTATVGKVDGGAAFLTASDQYVTIPSTVHSQPNLTYSAWVKATSFPNTYNVIVMMNGSNNPFDVIEVKSNGKLAVGSQTSTYDGTGTNTLTTGTWYYIVGTMGGAGVGVKGYVNGSLDGSNATGANLTSSPVATIIAKDGINGRQWNGALDEVRIAGVVRSADWITTEYNNQNAPGTFMALGTEVNLGGSTNPLSKKVLKGLVAILSFVGNLSRRVGTRLVATLTFNGALTKRIPKSFTAILSFVGSLNRVRLLLKAFTATLTFSGNLVRRMGKNLLAVLSFVGNLATLFIQGIQVFVRNFSATLTFSGTLNKRTRKFFSATLSFIGLLVRGFVSTWAYYIDLRPGAFRPTDSILDTTETTSELQYSETESAMTVAEADSILAHTETESGNFKNVITNDNS